MELELKRARLDAFDPGMEAVVTQEETAETIVPDYCPDIARIVETEGTVFLHSREIREGKALLGGTVRVAVLYTPDGERGVRTLEFAIPFSVESDSRAMPECTVLSAVTETEFLETRMLNPRKVFTHCKLVSRMTGYRRAALALTEDAAAEPAWGVEKALESQRVTTLTQIVEKEFTFSEKLELSAGKDGAAEVLISRVDHTVTETKLIGSKLILKGIFRVSLLYRTADGRCCSTAGELPFSQILEVESGREDAAAEVRLQLTGWEVQIADQAQDGRQIGVTLYLHAMAFLRQEQTVTLLSDLYSTAYEVSYEAAPVLLSEVSDPLVRRQSVREVLEIGVTADTLLSLCVKCTGVTVGREGSAAILRTGAVVRALYLDEGGAALAAERCIDVSCQMELPEDCRVTAWAVCPEEAQGSLGERGIEARFQIEFHAQPCLRRKRLTLTSVKIDTETPRDLSGAPSLVLRGKGAEETLWSLAKQYHTTVGTILSANELSAEAEVPPEKLLLIPRKRG